MLTLGAQETQKVLETMMGHGVSSRGSLLCENLKTDG